MSKKLSQSDAGPVSGEPHPQSGLHLLYAQEIARLHETIAQLLAAVKASGEEKGRADALSILIDQLRDANEHLVLATFGARDLQASAEATTQRQSEFLSMLAHELRNPLQPLAMANSLLGEHTGMHPTLLQVHEVNGRQIAQLVRLVDDLLDAARIAHGKITIRRAPLSLQDVIAAAVETASPSIRRRHQDLRVHLPVAELVMDGDAARLCQLFSNLLLNASKFTHEFGHIRISARRDAASAEIAVHDDGADMTPELTPVVFDLFTQGFRSLERAQGGLGVGLSMVRTIAELHGGSARAESAGPGQGSCFTVRLPLAEHAHAVGRAAAALPSARACTVLLIEDNIDANDVLAMLLRQAGHAVTQCFDGGSGLRTGVDGHFDLVICDIGLPVMDGFQVISAMCAALTGPRPCFVATSGYSDKAKIDLAAEAGFDHYLIKPINIAVLSRILAGHCLGDAAREVPVVPG